MWHCNPDKTTPQQPHIPNFISFYLAEVKTYWRLIVHKSLNQVIVAKYEGENMASDKQIGQS